MKLERFIYLNALDLASLYAQLHGEDVVEIVSNTEHSRTSGIKMAIAAFLKGSGESVERQSRQVKTVIRPENMLREIVANLRAQGTLNTSIHQAIATTLKSREPAWFECRHEFSIPLKMEEFNKTGTVFFFSGFPPYNDQTGMPGIEMRASIAHFPSARNSSLGYSGHDALFIRAQKGKPYPFLVFGALSAYTSDSGFQIKPVAIRL